MKTTLRNIFIALALSLAPISAMPPLSQQVDIDRTFKVEKQIFKGKILAATEQWTSGEDQISKDQAEAVMGSYFTHDAEHKKKYGVESSGPEAIAHREAWEQTDSGARFMKGLTGVRLLTVKVEAAVKGDFSTLPKTYRVAWERGFFMPCPHVGVSTEVGEEVMVVLRDGWQYMGAVLPERYFLIGDSLITPTPQP